VWNRRWMIVLLPIMASLTGAVLAGFIISDQVANLRTLEPFTVAKKTQEFVNISTVYFSLSVATSLTTMLLINLRIFLVQRHMKKTGIISRGNFNPVIEILIESAVLYSATLLVFVVFDVQKIVNLSYAQNIHAQMAGLALLLTILRVATGHLRPQEEWSRPSAFSDLEFAPSNSTVFTSKFDNA
ncbi:hypothetical protein C8J57DRAFT_1062642, partial [Mycena rebaudengoi]